MTALSNLFHAFVGNEEGATAIEYGLIAGLVTVGIIMAMTALGGSVTSLFGYVLDRAVAELDNPDLG